MPARECARGPPPQAARSAQAAQTARQRESCPPSVNSPAPLLHRAYAPAPTVPHHPPRHPHPRPSSPSLPRITTHPAPPTRPHHSHSASPLTTPPPMRPRPSSTMPARPCATPLAKPPLTRPTAPRLPPALLPMPPIHPTPHPRSPPPHAPRDTSAPPPPSPPAPCKAGRQPGRLRGCIEEGALAHHAPRPAPQPAQCARTLARQVERASTTPASSGGGRACLQSPSHCTSRGSRRGRRRPCCHSARLQWCPLTTRPPPSPPIPLTPHPRPLPPHRGSTPPRRPQRSAPCATPSASRQSRPPQGAAGCAVADRTVRSALHPPLQLTLPPPCPCTAPHMPTAQRLLAPSGPPRLLSTLPPRPRPRPIAVATTPQGAPRSPGRARGR